MFYHTCCYILKHVKLKNTEATNKILCFKKTGAVKLILNTDRSLCYSDCSVIGCILIMTGAQLGMLLMYSLGKDRITSVFNNPQKVSTYVTETSSIVNDVTNKSDGES